MHLQWLIFSTCSSSFPIMDDHSVNWLQVGGKKQPCQPNHESIVLLMKMSKQILVLSVCVEENKERTACAGKLWLGIWQQTFWPILIPSVNVCTFSLNDTALTFPLAAGASGDSDMLTWNCCSVGFFLFFNFFTHVSAKTHTCVQKTLLLRKQSGRIGMEKNLWCLYVLEENKP